MLVLPVAVASLVSLVAVQGHSVNVVDEDSFFSVSYSDYKKTPKKSEFSFLRFSISASIPTSPSNRSPR